MSASHTRSDNQTIGLVGPGRAGSALARALASGGADVVAVCGSSAKSEAALALANEVGASVVASPCEVAAVADITLVAVPDALIPTIGKRLEREISDGKLVGHVSGATALTELTCGVESPANVFGFHPAVTFPDRQRGSEALRAAPVAIAGRGRGLETARHLAELVGAEPFELAEESRALYHASCATASNLFVALQDAAQKMAAAAGIDNPRALLAPLVMATAANLSNESPAEALTGPVARGDAETVATHLDALRRHLPELEDLYRVIALHALEIAPLDEELRSGVGYVLAPRVNAEVGR